MRRGPHSAARPLSAYVYAFVSGPPGATSLSRRPVEVVTFGRVRAALEWRDLPFAATAATLRRQHAIVTSLARHHDAVVPARFGSLLDEEELRRVIRTRSKELKAALALVRGRVQMTVRIPLEDSGRASGAQHTSGTEYLNRRRPSVAVRRSAIASAIQSSVRPLTAAERIDVSSPAQLTMFHLIDRDDVGAYRAAVAGAGLGSSGPDVSGPFPAFAFAPDLWR